MLFQSRVKRRTDGQQSLIILDFPSFQIGDVKDVDDLIEVCVDLGQDD